MVGWGDSLLLRPLVGGGSVGVSRYAYCDSDGTSVLGCQDCNGDSNSVSKHDHLYRHRPAPRWSSPLLAGHSVPRSVSRGLLSVGRAILPTGSPTGGEPSRPLQPHRGRCRREARVPPGTSQREGRLSEHSERRSRLGRPEGCAGRCGRKWPTIEMLLPSLFDRSRSPTHPKKRLKTERKTRTPTARTGP